MYGEKEAASDRLDWIYSSVSTTPATANENHPVNVMAALEMPSPVSPLCPAELGKELPHNYILLYMINADNKVRVYLPFSF